LRYAEVWLLLFWLRASDWHMTPDEMRELRTAASLTQEELGKRLGVSMRSVIRMEMGQKAIDPPVEATMLALDQPVEPEIVLTTPEVVAPKTPTGWRAMTREQRQKLPPGSPGWVYRPWDVLPKGQWLEVLDAPVTFINGAVCTKIRWGSNGVGAPVMNLIGTTANAVDMDRDGFTALAPGVYRAMKPNKGNREFVGKDKPHK